MRIFKRYIVFLLIILSPMFLFSAAGYKFLNISPSPAYMALGNAGTTVDMKNASYFYYNPALLSVDMPYYGYITPSMKAMNLYFSYMNYFEDINYFSFFSVIDAKTIKRVGIGFTGMFYGDIPITTYDTENSYSKGGSLNISSYAFILGYGFDITSRLGMGINVKLPVENLGDEQYLGIGADIGTLYKGEDYGLGLVLENFGTDISAVETRHNLPAKVKLGGHHDFYLFKRSRYKTHKITAALDLGKELEGDFILSTGIQYSFKDIIYIRNGYTYNEDLHINIGVGFNHPSYKIDYAFKSETPGTIHMIGVGINMDFAKIRGLEVKEHEGGQVLQVNVQNSAVFNHNKPSFRRKYHNILGKVVDLVIDEGDREILICGYSADMKDKKYDFTLTQQRAQVLANYLIRQGVAREVIKIGDCGESKIAVKNKRVEIYLVNLTREEQEKFDYFFYNGMDDYMKEGYEKAIALWYKALSVDPDNMDVRKWIEKAEKAIKEKRADANKQT
ncbi:MAG: PorV/PorQ family protein [Spirochaetes bacterium]|nr:PorV/PorQ family protein [Spirochaetota bacterium]